MQRVLRRWVLVGSGVLLLASVLGGVAYVLVDDDSPTRDEACVAAISEQPEVPKDATIVRTDDYIADRFSPNVFGNFDVRWPLDGPPGEHQAIYVCEVSPSGEVLHVSND